MFTDIAKHKGNCLLLIKGSRLLLANLSKSKPLVQGKALYPRIFAKVMATCQWQYYLSKLSKSWLLVQAVQAVQVMAACPSHGCLPNLSKSRPLAQVNDHLSKQKLLVQVKAASQWPLVQGNAKARPRQEYLSKTTCPPRQGCLSNFQVKAACEGPLCQR